jgi:iron complex transport system substrate-binding protein
VLAGEINTPEQVKAFEDLKLPVYYLPNPTTLDGLYANIETVGKLTGHTTEAQKLNADLKKRVTAVTDAASKLTDRPKVFYELDGSEPAKPWTAGPGNFVDSLIKAAGGENVAAGLKSAYAQFSQEELLVTNPAIILLGDAAYGVTPEQVAQRPGWAGIKAVKDGKILAFDDNLVSRPGPRLVDGLEMLFKLIHP